MQALKQGAPVLGAAPRYDSDPAAQIERIFALAREFDVDLDLHLDVGDDPRQMHIYQVLELTERYRRGGRVVAGHMAKLSLLPPAEVAALARRLADAGIAVTVLPATDLYLMGRERDHAVVRGVADANLLQRNGVTCSMSSNNVLNAATPFGDCSLIRMANMHANVLQIAAPERVARAVPDADRAFGAAAEPEGLRARGRQPGRSGRDRRRDPGAGDRRNPPAAGGLEARPPHRHPPPAGTARARVKHGRAALLRRLWPEAALPII